MKTAREIAEDIAASFEGVTRSMLVRIIEAALVEYARAEREACARIAEDLLSRHEWSPKTAIGALQDVARRIREREA